MEALCLKRGRVIELWQWVLTFPCCISLLKSKCRSVLIPHLPCSPYSTSLYHKTKKKTTTQDRIEERRKLSHTSVEWGTNVWQHPHLFCICSICSPRVQDFTFEYQISCHCFQPCPFSPVLNSAAHLAGHLCPFVCLLSL